MRGHYHYTFDVREKQAEDLLRLEVIVSTLEDSKERGSGMRGKIAGADGYYESKDYIQRYVRGTLKEAGAHHVIVAVENGSVVGFLGYWKGPSTWLENSLQLDFLVAAPDAQNPREVLSRLRDYYHQVCVPEEMP